MGTSPLDAGNTTPARHDCLNYRRSYYHKYTRENEARMKLFFSVDKNCEGVSERLSPIIAYFLKVSWYVYFLTYLTNGMRGLKGCGSLCHWILRSLTRRVVLQLYILLVLKEVCFPARMK